MNRILALIILSFFSISCTQSGIDGVKKSGEKLLSKILATSTVVRLSNQSDRSQSVTLDGQNLNKNENYYIFIEDSSSTSKVEFILNGTLIKTENVAPYDMGGTLDNNLAYPIDLSKLNDGTNNLKVRINSSDETTVSFTYGLLPKIQLMHSLNSNRNDSTNLSEATLVEGKAHYIFLQNQDLNVDQVKFYLNDTLVQTESQPPYDMGGTDGNNSIAIDNSKLNKGSNTLTVKVIGSSIIEQEVQFVYSSSGVGTETQPDPTPTTTSEPTTKSSLVMKYSTSASRSNSLDLNGLTLSTKNDHYIFVPKQNTINKVEFFLNDSLIKTENLAPYDMGGSNTDDSAMAVDLSSLTKGKSHTLSVKVYYTDGSVVQSQAQFQLSDNTSSSSQDMAIQHSSSPSRSNSTSLNGMSLNKSQSHYIFIPQKENMNKVEFELDGQVIQTENTAPYDMGGTNSDDSAVAVNLSSISTSSSPTLRANIHYSDNSIVHLTAQFNVVEESTTTTNTTNNNTSEPTRTTSSSSSGGSTGVDLNQKMTSLSPYYDAYDEVPDSPEYTENPYCEARNGAKCYYIATNGSDSNSGTYNSPLASTTNLVAKLKAGDFVYVRGGTYTSKNAAPSIVYYSNKDMESFADLNGINGTKGNPITLRNYPGETPVIDLYKINPDFNPNSLTNEPQFAIRVKNASYIRVSGLEIVHGSIMVDGTNTSTQHVYLDNNHVHDFLSNSSNTGLIRISSAGYIHLRNNKLHDVYERKIKDSSDQWVLNTTKSHYDAIHNGCVTTLSGDTYSGYGNGTNGPITIAGTEFYNCPMAFFFKNPQGQLKDSNDYNSIILKNYFHDNGILAYYTLSNSLFEQNLVTGTSAGLYHTGREVYTGTDAKINEITSRNITMKNNVFIGMKYISKFRGVGFTGSNIYSTNYEDYFKFIDNVVIMSESSSSGAMSWSQDGFVFSNNYDGMVDTQTSPSKVLSKIISKGNCYASSKGSDLAFMKQFIMSSSGGVSSINGYSHQESKNLFNIDGSNDKFTTVTDVNQIFKDPANNDYTLKSGSPCQ